MQNKLQDRSTSTCGLVDEILLVFIGIRNVKIRVLKGVHGKSATGFSCDNKQVFSVSSGGSFFTATVFYSV